MPFAVLAALHPRTVVIGELTYEELSYTGQDDGCDSLSHSMGYQLADLACTAVTRPRCAA